MRTRYFYPHPMLSDLSYQAFSVVQELVVVTGGKDFAEDAINLYKNTLLIDLPKT